MDIKKIFQEYRLKIATLIPFADIQHVGGSAIPGAITKNDLDIQVRVEKSEMEEALKSLDILFTRRREELWNNNFAIFIDHEKDLRVDIMLTRKDSAFDTFARTRDILIANKDLFEEYNAIKRNYGSETYEIFSKHKRDFFDRIFKTHMDLES